MCIVYICCFFLIVKIGAILNEDMHYYVRMHLTCELLEINQSVCLTQRKSYVRDNGDNPGEWMDNRSNVQIIGGDKSQNIPTIEKIKTDSGWLIILKE